MSKAASESVATLQSLLDQACNFGFIRIINAGPHILQRDTRIMFTDNLITNTLFEMTVFKNCPVIMLRMEKPGRVTNTTARRRDQTAVARKEGQWLMLMFAKSAFKLYF